MLARLPIILLFAGCILWFTTEIQAQKPPEFRIAFQDSMVLQDGFRLLSNNIAISNPDSGLVTLGVVVRTPRVWRPVSPFVEADFARIELKKDESVNIPLNLLVTSKTEANWDSTEVKVWDYKTGDTFYYFPKIKVAPKYNYRIESINPTQSFMGAKPDSLIFKFKITNTGNISDEYVFQCKNDFFALKYDTRFKLRPKQDTTLEFHAFMTPALWDLLRNESIVVLGHSENLRAQTFAAFTVNRPSSIVYKNKLSYDYLPLNLGGGIMTSGLDIRYYGQVSTSFKVGDHTLMVDYRSRDLGPLVNTYQQDVLNANYSYKGFSASFGQITAPKNFYSISRGLALRYDDFRRGWGIYLAGMKHDPHFINQSFMNDNVFGGGYYHIKKVVLRHALESNFNRFTNVNSYLISNEIRLWDRKGFMVQLTGGTGYQVAAVDEQLPNVNRTVFGLTGGYSFLWLPRNWRFNSWLQYADTKYPGNTRGLFSQMVQASRLFGRVSFGLSYFSNVTTQNALRDTLFNSDYLQTNYTKLGLDVNYFNPKQNSVLSIGKIENSSNKIQPLKNGYYLDLVHNQVLGAFQNVSATFRNAMLEQKNGEMFLTNTAMLRLSSRNISIFGIYSRTPLVLENDDRIRPIHTVNGGPTFDFHLFKSAINGSVRYNFSKTISESAIRHGIGGQISFNGTKGGTFISASGYYPLKDPGNTQVPIGETLYGSLNFNQLIKIPYRHLNVRDVDLVLYKDINSSGQFDSGDSLLTDVFVEFDGRTLVSDDKGQIHYRNAPPGVYSMSFLTTKADQYVPLRGMLQQLSVQNENVVVEIPFRKGKRVFGSIQIDRDTLGTVQLTPDNFKVLVTDTAGTQNIALTDKDGKFEIFVPEGVYTVSLPHEYFTGSNFKPVQISYPADLLKDEEIEINFTIKQKKRTVRYLDSDKK